ncbi:hypothetical protein Purlil1_10900 [Purpureocillium lilacinum]|uniref:Inhibitor I9 domain-containing protein n=2 Tax=Purpureocillium lilacinum TaxID=33203 RepID=A0ABR0BLG3_PURLI|nr:hypothetical protein Purlil1_10900 [Purpureocillium lilacinum]
MAAAPGPGGVGTDHSPNAELAPLAVQPGSRHWARIPGPATDPKDGVKWPDAGLQFKWLMLLRCAVLRPVPSVAPRLMLARDTNVYWCLGVSWSSHYEGAALPTAAAATGAGAAGATFIFATPKFLNWADCLAFGCLCCSISDAEHAGADMLGFQKRLFCPSATASMPSYIVTCKDDATPEQVEAAKQHAKDQGGTIGHEYSLIKGFSVSFPNDAVTTLESNEHVKAVEQDGQMHTQ